MEIGKLCSNRRRGFLILVSLCFLMVDFFEFFFSLGGFYGDHDCGCWWWFLTIFCVSFPLGGCFLWLLLVVSLVMVVVTGRWHGGGKVAIFMWLFLLWLGFGFVHDGERDGGGR